MKDIKKSLLFAVTCLFFLFAITGCSKSTKLPEGFEEETVKAQTIQDIELAASNNYEGWVSRFAKELQGNLTPEAYDTYLEALKKSGEFKEYGKSAFVGQEKDGQKFAACLLIAEYENGNIQYTLGYDENMNLVQFTIK